MPTARRRPDPLLDQLHVTVVNGDLTFVEQPLLLGHYHSLKLTGTERVMDGLLGGAMSDGLRLGLYPDAPGSNRVFMNGRANPRNPYHLLPRPVAVVVVGLGEEGKLTALDLVSTVRLGVIEWARRSMERGRRERSLTVAATLIGSGGTGIAAGPGPPG